MEQKKVMRPYRPKTKRDNYSYRASYRYAERLGVPSSDFCGSWEQEEEPDTLSYFFWYSSELWRSRLKSLGDLSETADAKKRRLFSFASSRHWFGKRVGSLGYLVVSQWNRFVD